MAIRIRKSAILFQNKPMETNRELDIARYIVEKTTDNLFLTGKAGTGKTTFLRDIKRYTKKKHVVLAPTGVAAVNAGAMTIHSFFQFGFGPYVKGVSEPEPNFNMRKQKLNLIRSLELMIIDEISMVRADLLDHINDELQRIRRNYQPFGGVQMVMIGDLQQLPPVANGEEGMILNRHYESLYFFGCKALQNSDYYCIELKKVYRQTEQHFIDMLNRARTGELTLQDIDELNHRYAPSFHPTASDNYIRLVTHNRQADEINERELMALNSQEFSFEASVSKEFPSDMFPTSQSLRLRKGAQVMFIKNDPEKAFVNGTLGVVDSVDAEQISVRISGTDNVVNVEPMDWENIRYRLNEKTNTIEAEVKGTFKQYPLKNAWAITIHKSQGLTFDRAIIDVSKAFSSGQAYVALSRCRSLQGVVLSSKVTVSNFITDSIVDDYMAGAVQDIDGLAENIGYEYFDYDRSVSKEPAVKAKRTKVPAEVVNHNVYEAIKRWRHGVSQAIGKPAFCIFSDRTMTEIANSLPETVEELLAVKGIGPAKTELYGEAIIAVVRDSRASDSISVIKPTDSDVKETAARAKKEPKDSKIPTQQITFNLFKEGKTVAEIAKERSLAETTILGHLSKFVADGLIDVHQLVSDEVISKIAAYRRSHPEIAGLKEIHQYFNETISYGEIKFAMAYLERL